MRNTHEKCSLMIKGSHKPLEKTQTSEDFQVGGICRVFANGLGEKTTFRTKKTFVFVFQKSSTGQDTSIGLALSEKNLHILLAFCDVEASEETTWPLRTGQTTPPCKYSDDCVFFRRLCEPLECDTVVNMFR